MRIILKNNFCITKINKRKNAIIGEENEKSYNRIKQLKIILVKVPTKIYFINNRIFLSKYCIF